MSDSSGERQRKRPRPSPEPASPTSSSSSDASCDELYAILLAETAKGRSVEQAVGALFDTVKEDGGPGRHIGHVDLTEPVLAALSASPALENDLRTVARLCQAVLSLLQEQLDDISPRRKRLDLRLSSLCDVAKLIDDARNIVVLTGAGVSVSCGIPDFRSKGGLYDAVLERFGMQDPQAIFDLDEFKMDPSLFYSFAKDVMPSNELRPSPTHHFIAELEARGKLLRNYTQNIDGLERRAGVSEDRVILCHGSFLTATCMRPSCRAKISGSEISAEVAAGTVPICRKCVPTDKILQSTNNDSEDEDEDDDDACSMGVLKPDIVFFGENLPRRVSDNLERDVSRADLVLVLGTSLQVAPVARIPQYFQDDVPRILVNREPVTYDFDVELLGNCDAVVQELRIFLKWRQEQEEHIDENVSPPDWNMSTAKASEASVTDAKEVPANCRERPASGDEYGTKKSLAKFQPPRRFLFPGASMLSQEEKASSGAKERTTMQCVAGGETGITG